MSVKNNYSRLQLYALVVLRLFIGWHLLYEGITKLLIPNWTSVAFLRESQWVLQGFTDWVLSNPSVLNVVDFLNIWGLIAIGLGLILGLFSRPAAIFGAILLLMYYLVTPPLIGIVYSVPSDGNYLVINKTLIEALTLFILALFPTSHLVGLDMLVKQSKR